MIAAIAVISGCSKKPPVSVKQQPVKGGGLTAEEPSWAEKKNAPLKIQYAGPRGETEQVFQIVIVFNKPMVGLEAIDNRPSAADYVTIDPPADGAFHWLGTSAISFQPSSPLKNSTRYEVTVAKGLTAIDGKKLKKDYSWKFDTPTAWISDISAKGNWVQPADNIEIIFNQAVNPQDVYNNLSLYETDKGTQGTVPVSVSQPATPTKKRPKPKYIVVVNPLTKLRYDTSYTVAINSKLHGAEGLLSMKNDFSSQFSTYGPFKIRGNKDFNECQRSISIEFTNPVSTKEFVSHVKIEPPVQLEEYYESEADYTTESQYYPADLPPGKYKVTISGDMKDKFGQKLGDDYTFDYTSADYDSLMYLKANRGIIESKGPHKFPLYALNVDKARLRMLNLPDETIVPLSRNDDNNEHEDDVDLENSSFDYDKDIELSKVRNIEEPLPIDLNLLLKNRQYGLMFIKLTHPGSALCDGGTEDLSTSTLVQVTDLGLFAKSSWDNTVVWVTRISTGKPVARAKVTIRDHFNRLVWTGETNSNGLAFAPGAGKLFPPKNREEYHGTEMYVIAEKSGDRAFLGTDWTDGIETWNYNIPTDYNEGGKKTAGIVFAERGVYRPGETVHIKGIIRSDNFGILKTQPGKKIKLSVKDREYKEIFKKTIALNKFGSFSQKVKIPLSARLGYYSVYAQQEGTTNTIDGTFRVEEFRANEFEVKVKSNKDSYVFGETLKVTTTGKYMFGGAMKDAPIEWTVSQNTDWFSPPGHSGYYFGNNVYNPAEDYDDTSSGVLSNDGGFLSPQGSLTFFVPLKQGAKPATKRYLVEATVADESNQTVADSVSVLIHQGEFYIGLKPNKTFMKSGEKLAFNVITADPKGKIVTGRRIDIKLYSRQWHTVMQEQMYNHWYYESKSVDKVAGSCVVTTGSSAASCTFTIAKSGYYFVEARGTDRRGNKLLTSFDLYVTGSEYASWERENDNRINMIPDKKLYKPGDTASILIKSPYKKAKALITIEREKVFSSKIIDIKGTTPTIKVELPEKYAPNVIVSAVIIQGRSSEKLDKKGLDYGKPTFSVGYANLSISTARHRMRVKVAADKKEYRPGEKVSLKITTADHNGKKVPAEVAVMVVDEGVLSLTGYQTPDPHPGFYFERGVGVDTSTSYIHIIDRQNYGKKGRNPGGAGKGGEGYGILTRNAFKTCAYWNPSVVTKSNGEATVSFKLPDNLTKYRIMVVANTQAADFGRSQSSLRVNKPLMATPALPRFAIVEDDFIAGAVLHNNTGGKTQKINLSVVSEGVDILGPNVKTVALGPGTAKSVRFHFKARKAGKASFTFIAAMGDKSDSVRVSIPIVAPTPTETVAAYGVTADKAQQKIASMKSVRSDVGGLRLTVSSTALSGLEQGVEQVVEYPYGCLEQTVSRALPLVELGDIASNFNIEKIKGEKLRKAVQSSIDSLPLFQRSNGGMSYWKDNVCDDPYLSTYAYFFLSRASKNNFKIDEKSYNSLGKYLEGIIRGKTHSECWKYDLLPASTKAFILFALADSGKYEDTLNSFQTSLYDENKKLGLWGRAMLASAMKKSGGDTRLSAKLMQYLENHAAVSGDAAHFEEPRINKKWETYLCSDNWVTAVILSAMIESDPGNPLIPKVVRWLLKSRVNGKWRNTYETSFILVAMSDYYKKFEGEPPKFDAVVKLNSTELLKSTFKGRTTAAKSVNVPMSKIMKAGEGFLDISKSGSGLLYYSAALKYSPVKLNQSPVDEGFTVVTDYLPMNGGKATRTFKVGDPYKVTLTIISPVERRYVAVEDPIPAGFEIVNQTFKTSTRSLSSGLRSGSDYYNTDEASKSNTLDFWNWWVFNNVDMRDTGVTLFADVMPAGVYKYTYIVRATTAGRFFDPAAKASEMYSPDTFGRSMTGEIIVQ